MSWLKKILPSFSNKLSFASLTGIPTGLWIKCNACEASLYNSHAKRQGYVCEKCGHHLYIPARERLLQLFDQDSTVELANNILPIDHLKFKDSKRYKDRLQRAEKTTKENAALIVMAGQLKGFSLVACAFEFKFIGGSMGAAVGERFVQAVNHCLKFKCPLVCFSASGGARMQEGLFSLMQMSKTSAALGKLSDAGLPYISVLTHPTTGGVSASLAMLGDVIIAEPNALIGFAGPRVIEQTVGEKLPEGFQRSEFLFKHGAIDMIVHRKDLPSTLHRLLKRMSFHVNKPCESTA
jgi:acetyl-CoA carboxylase carboxyl transferase subunit beta